MFKGMGVLVNSTALYTLCFVDDQILIAQDYKDLSYMTRKLFKEYKKWGLQNKCRKDGMYMYWRCIAGYSIRRWANNKTLRTIQIFVNENNTGWDTGC